MAWILYSTLGCHLCEDALALIAPTPAGAAVRVVDIAEDEALFARYGLRIPVLQCEASGAELGWPFDAAALAAFIRAQPAA